MTEIVHLRCNRCGQDVAFNHDSHDPRERDWSYCYVGSKRYHFCPNCWQIITEFAKADEVKIK